MSKPLRAVVLATAVLLLSACASLRAPTPVVRDAPLDEIHAYAAQSAREAALAEQQRWRLLGRVAFVNGGESATSQIDWTQIGAAFRIDLIAPVTGRRWRLEGDAGSAVLTGLDDGPRHGPDAEQLLLEATGWRLPVAQLPAWVRGARGVGPAQALAVDSDGRPQGWHQAGWRLRFPDWLPGDPPLPRRVFADRGDASVRLVVSRWDVLP